MHRRLRRVMVVIGLALALAASGAVDAAEIGGTSWSLEGTGKTLVLFRGMARDVLTGSLVFDGLPEDTLGTCTLDVSAGSTFEATIPCVWTTGRGRWFRVRFDETALQDALTRLLGRTTPGALVTVSSVRGFGVEKPDHTRIFLVVRVQADATLQDRERKLFVELKLWGEPLVP